MKNSPIPIKFAIDIVGPVSLEPKCWYKLIDFNNPLDTLSPESIQKGKDENKIQPPKQEWSEDDERQWNNILDANS